MTGTQMNDTPDREPLALARGQDIPKVDANRVEQIRARIHAGAYATDRVLQATARAIVERGDV